MRAPHSPRFALLLAGSVCALGASVPVHAQALQGATRVVQTEIRTAADKRDDEERAREWNLRAEDWSRYRTLMQGPLGTYSPHLDPLTALGIEARSDEERRRFAELQVQAEARRVQKTLNYQRAYDAAWQRLHPDLQRVALPSGQAGGDVRGAGAGAAEPGRLAVFVKEACAACDQRVQQLQSAGTTMDVYVVGSRGDDERIRRWARQAAIDPAKVQAKAITLNHDGGRWLSLGLPGELPAVVREVGGQWQRQ
ncbi:TIGR03759 family integrating conjugative element protein [Xanthomonas axonopodis pv. begoniae]|nr:TIGR03759 family integrating conjugative element protein [Xanthomonas axonopodis pv. begoniae]MBO9772932.1 TIGR03759 family integrating conjugative element protein [Xanthomonas axonopodis pv. begoniae]PPT31992.1 TIGR03759 family integrating conjugative element protein [Xanthomonas axonopodis pv. begoniae]